MKWYIFGSIIPLGMILCQIGTCFKPYHSEVYHALVIAGAIATAFQAFSLVVYFVNRNEI